MTTFTTHNTHGVGNGTTPVDVVAAPPSSHTFDVRNVIVNNKDAAQITVMLNLVDSAASTTTRLCNVTLDPNATMEFDSLVTLDATTKNIQLVLAATPTTQPDFCCSYGDTGP